ncbi:MAG: AraC family transcriptional regulator [Clostridia bacterium]|nr:AraC family transcriptional regulator [Clostridia bacterium]
MLLSSINPFIRFAQTITVDGMNTQTISYDSRLFYVCNGFGMLSILGREYQLKSGNLLIWRNATPYKFIINNSIKLIAVNFDFTQKNIQKKDSIRPVPQKDFNQNELLEQIYFSDFEVLNKPIILCNMQLIKSKLDVLTDEFSKKKLGYDAFCSAVLKEIIIDAARIASINIPENSYKIEKVVQYIEAHFGNDISNSDLAAVAGYHPYHLNRLMKSTTGMTLHSYILNTRLENSKNFLLNTNMSIAEIAEKCGFKNSYHFSNTFKSKIGLTPTLFRNTKKEIL